MFKSFIVLQILCTSSSTVRASVLQATIAKQLNAAMVHDMVQLNPASIDETDGDGFTALTFAAMDGNVDLVKALIAEKADVDRAGTDGTTALMFASANDDLAEVVKVLIESGADVELGAVAENETALMLAAEYGQTEAVRLLISAGASMERASTMGHTALILAIANNRSDVVDVLVQSGARTTGLEGHAVVQKALENKFLVTFEYLQPLTDLNESFQGFTYLIQVIEESVKSAQRIA